MNELLSDLDLDEPGDSSQVKPPKTQGIEKAILLLADTVWAVVGLFLWIPQIVRVVITSAVRLIHAALTRQPTDGIRVPIRQVSRFYIDGFLSPGQQPRSGNYGARELQLGRFLTEAVWVAAVWLGVLRLANQDAFNKVWQSLSRSAVWVWAWVKELTSTLIGLLPEGVQDFADLGTGASLALAFALIVFLAAGFLLGRKLR